MIKCYWFSHLWTTEKLLMAKGKFTMKVQGRHTTFHLWKTALENRVPFKLIQTPFRSHARK